MSDLSEVQILGCLRENFRLAAEDCDRLARGERGPVYTRLRRELKLLEGACRQLTYYREDTRWLKVGLQMAQVQERSGRWLRERQPGWRFAKLAEILRAGQKSAEALATKATGKLGVILPEALPAPHRDTKPVSMSKLILPPGFKRMA